MLAVIGGESTGKSTLARALARDLPAVQVPETLRSWVERHGRVPRADEQRAVMREHAEAEAVALDHAAQEGLSWVVSDSGPLMTAVYSLLYYDDSTLLDEALALTARARLVVWCSDDFPWASDPMRDGPEVRQATQVVIGEVIPSVEAPWVMVSGSVAQRVAQVRAAIPPTA